MFAWEGELYAGYGAVPIPQSAPRDLGVAVQNVAHRSRELIHAKRLRQESAAACAEMFLQMRGFRRMAADEQRLEVLFRKHHPRESLWP